MAMSSRPSAAPRCSASARGDPCDWPGEDAMKAFKALQYGDATTKFESGMIKDPGVTTRTPAAYYFGVAYNRQNRPNDAMKALDAFVARSLIGSTASYDDAEKRLAKLGQAPVTCK